MPNNSFALYLDELRESRNMTKEDFVEDIISMRQYYRFLKGESSLKSESITMLLDRLNISTLSAYKRFILNHDITYNKLKIIYLKIQSHDFEDAMILLEGIQIEEMTSNTSKSFYNFLEVYLEFYQNKIPMSTATTKIKKIIKYPEILSKKLLSFYETSALFFISSYVLTEEKDNRIAEYVYEVIKSKDRRKFLEGEKNLPPFYATCAINFGIMSKYKESIAICEEGLKICNKYKISNSYNLLLLYKSVGEYKLGEDKKCKETLTRLFSFLRAEADEMMTLTYKRHIKEHMNIVEADLITYEVDKDTE